MSVKPLVINELTQEQRNRYVRCAGYNGQKLSEWVRETLDAAASKVLHFEDNQPKLWQAPNWLTGLSQRSATCLLSAGYIDLRTFRQDWDNKPKAHFYAIPNFGNKTFNEIETWLTQQNPN